tara:strand:+ start:8094 stop:8732 length:639 start_codon:yes stop_codon:yes gene_type:complete
MARNLTSAYIAAMIAADVKVTTLARFDFESSETFIWSGIGDLVYDGETWTGVGTLGSINPAASGTDISAQGAVFTLSGIPASLISLGLTNDYQNRACEWRLALLDSSDAVIATPFVWTGRMDVMTISENGDTAEITITAENRLIDLFKPREERYTHQEQIRQFAGDLGLEFASSMPDKEIWWGSANKAKAVPSGYVFTQGGWHDFGTGDFEP